MALIYNCTVCDEGFGTKSERNSDFSGECQLFIRLRDCNGDIKGVERMDEKLRCPRCRKKFKDSPNLITDWKIYKVREGMESIGSYIYENWLAVQVEEEDVLVTKLRYDGEYDLAVYIDCEYGLPLEWIKKHFIEQDKVKVDCEWFALY
jgi:hypothetical protein